MSGDALAYRSERVDHGLLQHLEQAPVQLRRQLRKEAPRQGVSTFRSTMAATLGRMGAVQQNGLIWAPCRVVLSVTSAVTTRQPPLQRSGNCLVRSKSCPAAHAR